jgi:hypothetical protein
LALLTILSHTKRKRLSHNNKPNKRTQNNKYNMILHLTAAHKINLTRVQIWLPLTLCCVMRITKSQDKTEVRTKPQIPFKLRIFKN